MSFRNSLAFLATVALGTILISATSTHIILQGLSAIGADMPLQVRIDAILRDLVGFGPTLSIVLAIGFLIAFWVASMVIKNLLPAPIIGYTLAGFIAVIVMMLTIRGFYFLESHGGNIHPVPAARTVTGLLALSVGGAVAGFFYANFSKTPK